MDTVVAKNTHVATKDTKPDDDQIAQQDTASDDAQSTTQAVGSEGDAANSEVFELPDCGTVGTLRLGDIIEHPDNARTVYPKLSAASEEELRASLLADGLIQPIVVVQLPNGWGALAGERRRRNLYHLATLGKITLDQMIPVLKRVEHEDGNRTSHAENVNRLPMKAWETYEHIAVRFKGGQSVEDIAKSMGRSVKDIRLLLRLGRLHRSVFSALKKGTISLEVAHAYALTDNLKKQKAVWDAHGVSGNAHQVRRDVREGTADSDGALAKFVTIDAYKLAGGAVTEELFGDKVALHNVELLEKLAREKLESLAAGFGEGWGWMLIDLPSEIPTELRYGYKPMITSRLVGVPKEIKQQKKDLDASLQDLEDWLETFNYDETKYTADDERVKEDEKSEVEAQLVSLNALLLAEYTKFDKRGMPMAGCVVTFDNDGVLDITAGVLRDAKAVRQYNAKSDSTKAGKSDDAGSATTGDEGKGRSAAFARDLGMYVRAAKRTSIARDPELARDLLDFHMLSTAFKGTDICQRWRSSFLSISGDYVADSRERPEGDVCAAEKTMKTLLRPLPTDWIGEDDDSKRFELFKAIDKHDRDMLMAWVVATRLDAGQSEVGQGSLPTAINSLIKVDQVKYFRPTAETYFNRCDLATLTAHGVEWYGEKFAGEVEAMKGARKKLLAQRFSDLFVGDESVLSDHEKQIRKTWLPAEFHG